MVATAFAGSLAFAQTTATAPALQPLTADTILIENATAKVTKRDLDLEMARMPPEVAGSVINNPKRLSDVIGRLLVMKTLAQQARAQGLDRDPEVVGKLALETDRLYAQVRQSKVDDEAAAEFDAKRAQWQARAREVYALEQQRFTVPEQVSAAHILFSVQKHTNDEAKKLVDDAKSKIAAGSQFNDLARALSEDPTAKQNGGSIGYFARSEVHPAFASAAFALKNVGDVSEPVLTSFGWHLIKLEGRRPPQVKKFEDVRDQIMLELKNKFVADRRAAFLDSLGNDPSVKPNSVAIEALYQRPPDEQTLRGTTPAGTASQPAAH